MVPLNLTSVKGSYRVCHEIRQSKMISAPKSVKRSEGLNSFSLFYIFLGSFSSWNNNPSQWVRFGGSSRVVSISAPVVSEPQIISSSGSFWPSSGSKTYREQKLRVL